MYIVYSLINILRFISLSWYQSKGLGGVAIEEISGCVECLDPIRDGHASLKKERANNIIGGANNALGSTILGQSVWAGQTEGDTMSEKERAGVGVIKLTAIAALNILDGDAELSGNISKKMSESGECVRLEAERKSPKIVRAIIEND
jgi:hypothetical protein